MSIFYDMDEGILCSYFCASAPAGPAQEGPAPIAGKQTKLL